MNTHHIHQLLLRMCDGLVQRTHRKKILHWMADGKDANDKDAALFRIWNDTSGSEITPSETSASLSQVKSRLGIDHATNPKHRNISSALLRYAAIFLLPLVTGVAVWFYMSHQQRNAIDMIECFVPKGEQKRIVLPDGTHVTLNSGSLFIYPKEFSKDTRNVFLTGEAYFDVAHNEKNPFLVHTGRLNIKVLGTSFNIEAYSDDSEITTTLRKGRVKVFPANQSESEGITMQPNEQVVYHIKEGRMALSTVNAEDFAAWTKGDLHFVERSLADVLKIIGRKYDVEFRYDNQIKLDELYTIVFRQEETIEQVMRVMKSLIGNEFDYTINDESVYLYSVKKGGNGR